MSTNKKLKILLYGDVLGTGAFYRSRALIKFLLDFECSISLVCPNFYVFRSEIKQSDSFVKKFLVRIHLAELFIKAAFADVIYVLPLNTYFIKNATLAAKLFNKKLVVEAYISLYDTLLNDGKALELSSNKAKAAIYKDKLALTKPDYIIGTSNHEPAYWGRLLDIKLDMHKVFAAPVFSKPTSVLKRNFMQDRVLRICWWGTFIPLHGLDSILQAMKLLKKEEIQFTCSLFGINNPFFSVYKEKIQSEELDSHVFLRKDLNFFNDSLPQYLVENCDLALGIFGNVEKARNATPNKLIEALSMGIPTLTMSSPALKEFFNPEVDFWTCEPSPESIAVSIRKIAGGAAYPVDWEQTRQKVLATFSITRYQKVVTQILEKITDEMSKAQQLL